jgi:hypothetical protein
MKPPPAPQRGQAGDVAGEVGAAWAVVVGPVVHELVDNELSLSGEQVEQRFRAG